MYTCERCGTGFGRPGSLPGSCPRCLARDGVRVALTSGVPEEGSGIGGAASAGLEATVRKRLAVRQERPSAAGGLRDAA
jgi:hypothetical protein